MFAFEKIPNPKFGIDGLEAGLSEEEHAVHVQDAAHRFAEQVRRPIGCKLDKMTPDQVVAAGSPLWDYVKQMNEARASLPQRVVNYNYGPNGPHLVGSITSKTYATQAAFEVATEALQMFGGNGLTKEYPLEKVFRDARAALIEDGENNLLSLVGASWLSTWYKQQHGLVS
jgi:alkylation response protein AidB-like acyl-CoA dehydrogenase